MNETELMEVFERTGAILNGHFELRSGLHSDAFFQCANVLRHPREAARLAEALAARLRALDLPAVDGVIAPALGGILVGYELARALDTVSIFAEKHMDRLVLRRFDIRSGERWIVAEDVVTRGGRVRETMDLVRSAGATVAAVAYLVDRSGGATAFDGPVVCLAKWSPKIWEPAACPLCRAKIPCVHPGS